MVTPGTLFEPEMLSETKNNYVCAICETQNATGVCFADVSTAKVYATNIVGDNRAARLQSEVATFAPSEVILSFPREDAPDLIAVAGSSICSQIATL